MQKKGGFGGPKNFHHEFLAILVIKMVDFLKLEHFFKTIFEN